MRSKLPRRAWKVCWNTSAASSSVSPDCRGTEYTSPLKRSISVAQASLSFSRQRRKSVSSSDSPTAHLINANPANPGQNLVTPELKTSDRAASETVPADSSILVNLTGSLFARGRLQNCGRNRRNGGYGSGDGLVGMGRFELPTSPTRKECSTKLSHIPTNAHRRYPTVWPRVRRSELWRAGRCSRPRRGRFGSLNSHPRRASSGGLRLAGRSVRLRLSAS